MLKSLKQNRKSTPLSPLFIKILQIFGWVSAEHTGFTEYLQILTPPF